MNYLKMLGPIVAATALMAFVGTGTASATVLCSTNTNPCTSDYGAGTKIEASLVPGTKAKLSTSFKTIECGKSSVSGKSSTTGGSTSTVSGSGETLTLEECNCEVKVLKTGGWEYHWISGGPNATVTWNGPETTTTCSTIFGNVHCIYGGTGIHVGTITGGPKAKMHWNFSWPRVPTNGLCSEEATMTAEYEINSPTPLFIASS